MVQHRHEYFNKYGERLCPPDMGCANAMREDETIDHIVEWADIDNVLHSDSMRALGIEQPSETFTHLRKSLFNDMAFPPTTNKDDLREIASTPSGRERIISAHPSHLRNLQLMHSECNNKKSARKTAREREKARMYEKTR